MGREAPRARFRPTAHASMCCPLCVTDWKARVHGLGRWAVRASQLGGQHVQAGDMLVLGVSAANADPEIRSDPTAHASISCVVDAGPLGGGAAPPVVPAALVAVRVGRSGRGGLDARPGPVLAASMTGPDAGAAGPRGSACGPPPWVHET